MDLSVNIAGIKLRSPIIASSSVDGMDGERIVTVSARKLGASITKTIVKNMQTDVLPNIKRVRGDSMINCVFGTNLTARQWFEEEFPKAKKAGIPIIANMAGTTPEEAIELAKGCEAAGADMIEYPTACPHMGNILEAMFPGLKVPLPEVNDPSDYARQIEAVKKAVKIPVMAKFSSIYHLTCKEWAKAVEDAGGDAISAADSIGPVMDIDVETGQPVLGGPRGYSGLTGAAIRPLVLRMVLEITETVNIPVIGIGGISTGEEAAQFIMAGASAVALSSAALLKGSQVYSDVYDGLEAFMERKGYTSLADFKGLTHRRIEERKAKGRQIIKDVVVPTLVPDKCIACGLCRRACPYGAISADGGKPVFDPAVCHGCGLCVSVCASKAIGQEYYE
ncbi:MAG: 4Fe-4S binding protein [Lachnospiraceae bacterium]|nr:4Fe-4S binding protein [Lachnospiraceae bacterium]